MSACVPGISGFLCCAGSQGSSGGAKSPLFTWQTCSSFDTYNYTATNAQSVTVSVTCDSGASSADSVYANGVLSQNFGCGASGWSPSQWTLNMAAQTSYSFMAMAEAGSGCITMTVRPN